MERQSIFGVIFTFLLAVIWVETYVIIKQAISTRNLKKEIPLLLKGETIKHFDMIDADGNTLKGSVLKKVE